MPHRFADLPIQARNDIADILSDSVAKHIDVIEIERRLQEENPEMRVAFVPIKFIQFPAEYQVTVANVFHYAALSELTCPPVLMSGQKLLDGGHRIVAALVRGEKKIRRVDIGFLMDRQWA